MTPDEARIALATIPEDEDDRPILPIDVLRYLTKSDVPKGVYFDIGNLKEDGRHLDWSGTMFRDGNRLVAEANYCTWRKYWYSTLGMEQYFDLIRRAVETRHRIRGDVQVTHYEEGDTHIDFFYTITTSGTGTLYDAYREALQAVDEIEQTARRAEDEAGKLIAEVAARLSGQASQALDKLVHHLETAASPDDRGRTLEELCSRLLETVSGFHVTGRLRTATEEIDISIVNNSNDPRLRRESALILVECKNWSGKCGKNEFVIFKEKIENRNRRCSLGLLVSWNGFAETVTKEMLRGSREDTLVIPITGSDIRRAVAYGEFTQTLLSAWDKAVAL
ncbi:MAG: restriction endonuclease [Candidatus Angelobacter sp.]